MKTRIVFVFALIASTSFATTYYPTDYRVKFATAENGKLKKLLYAVLTKPHLIQPGGDDVLVDDCKGLRQCYGHRTFSYRRARRLLLGRLHLERDVQGHFIRDAYCLKEFSERDAGVGPDVIPTARKINCEHTWPRSKFNRRFSRLRQTSDLHNLYPVDAKSNSARNNLEFADGGRELPYCQSSRKTGKTFEPPAEHKGNVARALFYFSVRYKRPISKFQEKHLRRWHISDPPDERERRRNDRIHRLQGNRNPFIDFPELVEQIEDF